MQSDTSASLTGKVMRSFALLIAIYFVFTLATLLFAGLLVLPFAAWRAGEDVSVLLPVCLFLAAAMVFAFRRRQVSPPSAPHTSLDSAHAPQLAALVADLHSVPMQIVLTIAETDGLARVSGRANKRVLTLAIDSFARATVAELQAALSREFRFVTQHWFAHWLDQQRSSVAYLALFDGLYFAYLREARALRGTPPMACNTFYEFIEPLQDPQVGIQDILQEYRKHLMREAPAPCDPSAWDLVRDWQHIDRQLASQLWPSAKTWRTLEEEVADNGEHMLRAAQRIAARLPAYTVGDYLQALTDSSNEQELLEAASPEFRVQSFDEASRRSERDRALRLVLYSVLRTHGGKWERRDDGELLLEWKGEVLPAIDAGLASNATSLGIDLGWSLTLTEDERQRALLPRVDVQVEDGGFSVHSGQRFHTCSRMGQAGLVVPKRCAQCGSSEASFSHLRLGPVFLPIPSCVEHQSSAKEHFTLVRQKGEFITLRAKFDGFAELVKLAND